MTGLLKSSLIFAARLSRRRRVVRPHNGSAFVMASAALRRTEPRRGASQMRVAATMLPVLALAFATLDSAVLFAAAKAFAAILALR